MRLKLAILTMQHNIAQSSHYMIVIEDCITSKTTIIHVYEESFWPWAEGLLFVYISFYIEINIY